MTGVRPIVKEIDQGYLLGMSEGNKDIWMWTMTTEEMATLWQFGVTVYPAERNTENSESGRRWIGCLVFESYSEAFVIWERYICPRLLASKMSAAG